MIPTLKSEFRKLFTIRSTYFIILIAVAISALAAYFAEGRTALPYDAFRFRSALTNAAPTIGQISAIASVLLVAHEYRYNTIIYTFTSVRSRLRVLVAKAIVGAVFAIGLGLLCAAVIYVMMRVGMAVSHIPFAAQQLDIVNSFGRYLYHVTAYTMLALLLTTIIRSIPGILVTLFLVMNIVEALLSLVLKDNTRLLPLMTLQSVSTGDELTRPAEAMIRFTGYLAIVGVISAYLFVRRDAN